MEGVSEPVDVVLIGGGVMSATLGSLLKTLQPDWTITVLERLDEAGLTVRPLGTTGLMVDVGEKPATEPRGSEPEKLTRLVRGELDWIVMRCLEKDRTRRYATAQELARDVERYLAGDPVDAPHFRVATVVPVLGVASCVLLLTQQDAVTWLRAGILLAVGAAVKRAVVSDDAVRVRPIMAVTLSVDHRATSGAEGARLLASIKRLLEQPVLLLA